MIAPRRFWSEVSVVDTQILLDGKPLRTPTRSALSLPGAQLADAIAEEWRAVEQAIDPRAMPLTGLANAAIDRVATNRPTFVRTLAAYAETDLLCYRADAPASLVDKQSSLWDPPLEWARARYDAAFTVTAGIGHVAQPSATIARLAAAIGALDSFQLAALSPLTTLSGSLVLALALAEGVLTAEAAWAAAELDELWQAERWGEDELAAKARQDKRAAFLSAARFLSLV